MSLQKNIRDLIHFYVKTNYEAYLSEKDIKIIPEDEIDEVIKNLYDDRKSHIQTFILESLKTLYKDKTEEYPGDRTIKNILLNISLQVKQNLIIIIIFVLWNMVVIV